MVTEVSIRALSRSRHNRTFHSINSIVDSECSESKNQQPPLRNWDRDGPIRITQNPPTNSHVKNSTAVLTRDAGPKPHIAGFSRLRREKPARALHRRATAVQILQKWAQYVDLRVLLRRSAQNHSKRCHSKRCLDPVSPDMIETRGPYILTLILTLTLTLPLTLRRVLVKYQKYPPMELGG